MGFPGCSAVKSLLSMQETRAVSLSWEDSLEESTETHSSILAGRIPRTEEPGRLQPRGSPSQKQLKQLSTNSII